MATLTRDFNALPQTRDYALRQGETIDDTWALTADGTAFDASGWTSITLRVVDSDGTAQSVAGSAITAGGASNNEVRILISATDSATWEGTYRYEVQAIIPDTDTVLVDGATRTLVFGTIEVTNPI